MSFAVQHYLYPAKKQFLQYTTTSPAMQKRLGVAGELTVSMDERLAGLLRLLELERLEVNIFRGESRDIGSPQVYGGQVLGQALQAAYATVEAGRVVHSLHAYFLRRGDFNAPIVYFVDRSRDGHSFTSRRVTAIQHGEQIFNCSASFQLPEAGLEHQLAMPEVPSPEELPESLLPGSEFFEGLSPRLRQFVHERPIEFRVRAGVGDRDLWRAPRASTCGSARSTGCRTTIACTAACSPTPRTFTCWARRWRTMSTASPGVGS